MKTQAQHTPTPWKVMSDGRTIVSDGPGKDFVAETIPRIDNNGKTHDASNHEIDADFICKAVNAHEDLVKACKAQHAAIDHLFALLISKGDFMPSRSGQPWRAALQANKAIAKAEGP